MQVKEIEIVKVHRMFADADQKMIPSDLIFSLQCLGFVVKEDFQIPKNKISLEEYKEIVENLIVHPEVYTKLNCLDAFRSLDQNNTGYVKANDLKNVFMHVEGGLTEQEITDFFTTIVPNAKGEISYKVLLEKLVLSQEK